MYLWFELESWLLIPQPWRLSLELLGLILVQQKTKTYTSHDQFYFKKSCPTSLLGGVLHAVMCFYNKYPTLFDIVENFCRKRFVDEKNILKQYCENQFYGSVTF
jgi:hypothetical protein